MRYAQPLHEETKRYLFRYEEILDEMIRGMTEAELTCSISHNFIVQMIPHHRAAIEMSENLLRDSTFEPLRRIAQNIVSEQTKSIEAMQRALPTCAQVPNTRQELCQYAACFRQITQTMFSGMRNASADNDINADFMREMIPHHQGAIRMSKNALRYPICPELDPILRAIIVSQEKGVRQMQRLLDRGSASGSASCTNSEG